MSATLSPEQTAQALPYPLLAQYIKAVLLDPSVKVPPRIVAPLADGGSLFVMPASDGQVAITKLITFVASNPQQGLPAIQGDVVIFDARTGRRLHILDGPTVTARRTAAVSLLAAMELAAVREGPMLIVGAGVQGKSHLEAFVQGLGVREVWIASRSDASAQSLVTYARTLGVQARQVTQADEVLQECSLVISCTSAQGVALHGIPRQDAFIAAVGAFTPRMVEWAPQVCRHIAAQGQIVVDTRDADHEAGDLIQAQLEVSSFPSLADVVRGHTGPSCGSGPARQGPVLFKSCGWAGWDLAAARCMTRDR